ncbi:MAG: hypothetical protein AB8G14_08835 [Ilumatobacter sp.]
MTDLTLSNDELEEIEAGFRQALTSKSFDGLNVLGFGELGVAFGFPTGEPRLVVKRVASHADPAIVQHGFDRITRYEALLAPHLRVTDSAHVTTTASNGWLAPYIVQPLYPKHTIGDSVLADCEPDPEHPMVLALRDAAVAVAEAGETVLDSQFSNVVWDDDGLLFFDTGSPFFVDADGEPLVDLGPAESAIPAPMRPIAKKLSVKVQKDLSDPSGNLAHAALSAVRVGQERWLDALLVAFNDSLDQPLERTDVMEQFARIQKDMTNIKYLARAQRFWMTKVRRGSYDFFITDSFNGKLI